MNAPTVTAHAVLDLPEFPVTAGNRVTFFADGARAFEAMREAISGARDHINLETFIFRHDRTGREIADLLMEKAANGVLVHVIYDSVGSIETPDSFWRDLAREGVRVVEFRPVAPWKPRWRWRLNVRDHRKILLVDGNVGFVGGLNIGDEYAGLKGGNLDFRDTHARIEGPGVAGLERIFLDQWALTEGHEVESADYFPTVEPAGETKLRFFATAPLPGHRLARRFFLTAILSARKSIHMTYGYFMPERSILGALRRAARTGVDVRIVLPRVTDVPLVRLAGRSAYRRLLKAGVRIFERLKNPLHAKSIITDGTRAIVGSANLDARSFFLNFEVGVELFGAGPGNDLEEIFRRDVQRSEEIRPEAWRRRPLREKLLERACRAFQPFL